jgi:hypothetical protein
LKGTTAELKMLFERGSRSRGMTGFRLDRQSGPTCPAGRSCQGMEAGVGGASIGVVMARGPSCGTLTRWLLLPMMGALPGIVARQKVTNGPAHA